MLLSGFVSNGEYNVFRSKGYTRPLSVLRIEADVRQKYTKMGQQKMLNMLTPKCECTCSYTVTCIMYFIVDNGKIVAVEFNPAVSDDLINEIFNWRRHGIVQSDIINRLRARTVPAGYPIHPWKSMLIMLHDYD